MVTAKKYCIHGLGKAGVFNSFQILKSYGCKKVFVDPDKESYHYYQKKDLEKAITGNAIRRILYNLYKRKKDEFISIKTF